MPVRAPRSSTGAMSRALGLIGLMLLMAALGGCGGTRGFRSSCRFPLGGGSCDGRYAVLADRTLASVDDDQIVSTDALQIHTELSVEQGRVRASFATPDGAIESIEATPGNPAVLDGVAKPYVDGPDLYFEPVDGEAMQVRYAIRYSIMRNGGGVEGEQTQGSGGTFVVIGIVALAAIVILVVHFKRGARTRAS
jgi:hypothetical protein